MGGGSEAWQLGKHRGAFYNGFIGGRWLELLRAHFWRSFPSFEGVRAAVCVSLCCALASVSAGITPRIVTRNNNNFNNK